MSQDAFERVKTLVKLGKIDAARQVLQQDNSPKARALLAKFNERYPLDPLAEVDSAVKQSIPKQQAKKQQNIEVLQNQISFIWAMVAVIAALVIGSMGGFALGATTARPADEAITATIASDELASFVACTPEQAQTAFNVIRDTELISLYKLLVDELEEIFDTKEYDHLAVPLTVEADLYINWYDHVLPMLPECREVVLFREAYSVALSDLIAVSGFYFVAYDWASIDTEVMNDLFDSISVIEPYVASHLDEVIFWIEWLESKGSEVTPS